MEQYSPWQLQAEGTTRELKEGAVRNMVQSGAPRRIWDNALDFEAYVRSNTAFDIYILRGEVPETVMLGGTSDISQFCEYGFYDWFIFRDDMIQDPDENQVLDQYLGREIDVVPEMIAKIMKINGEVLHRSTYRGLNHEERTNHAHILLREEFDSNMKDRFGAENFTRNFSWCKFGGYAFV